jgi:hypothetical protein
MKTNQAKTDAILKEIIAEMRAWQKGDDSPPRAMMKGCLEKMKAMDMEANPEETRVQVRASRSPERIE